MIKRGNTLRSLGSSVGKDTPLNSAKNSRETPLRDEIKAFGETDQNVIINKQIKPNRKTTLDLEIQGVKKRMSPQRQGSDKSVTKNKIQRGKSLSNASKFNLKFQLEDVIDEDIEDLVR